MKKSIKLLFVAGLLAVLSGCSAHLNTLALVSNSPEVILRENNFRVVGMAKASTSINYVLGIGGISRDAVRENAVAELFKNAKLKGSQALINITERVSVTGLPPIFATYTITTVGTIIEFTGAVNVEVLEKSAQSDSFELEDHTLNQQSVVVKKSLR